MFMALVEALSRYQIRFARNRRTFLLAAFFGKVRTTNFSRTARPPPRVEEKTALADGLG
jgi:hypothetical protein